MLRNAISLFVTISSIPMFTNVKVIPYLRSSKITPAFLLKTLMNAVDQTNVSKSVSISLGTTRVTVTWDIDLTMTQ